MKFASKVRRLKARVTRRRSLVLDKQKRFQLPSELAETVRWPQWSRQLVPKPRSGDIKRPVAKTSSGPRVMPPDERRRRLASGADQHASERYDSAQQSAVWEMLINLPKCRILQGKWKSDLESVSGTGSPPKVDQFFRLVGPIITPSFNERRLTDTQANTHTQTKQDRIHDLLQLSLAEVTNNMHIDHENATGAWTVCVTANHYSRLEWGSDWPHTLPSVTMETSLFRQSTATTLNR